MRAFELFILSLGLSSAAGAAAHPQQEVLYGVRGPGGVLSVLDPSVPHQLSSAPLSIFGRGLTYDGSQLLTFDSGIAENLVRIQPENGFTQIIGPLGLFEMLLPTLKWHPGLGKLYAKGTQLFPASHALYTIDPATGTATLVAPLQGFGSFPVDAFAFDPSGQAWATAPDGYGQRLFHLDLTTGMLTLKGYLNGILAGALDMEFDSQGQLWMSIGGQGPLNGLYQIDVATLVATQVYGPQTFVGLAFAPGCVATSYCTAKANSLGCTPRLTISGQVSASQVGGILRVDRVQSGLSGLLVFGLNGRASTPLFGGTLCVAPPLRQTPLGTTREGASWLPPPCRGTWTIDMSLYLSTHSPLPAGTVVDCQWWGRDPGLPLPEAVSLSNGLEFMTCP
ncbi:MAG TPA: hypothetical protein VMS76_15840 [Planctomycetota bacterium]|nr:hypothetical protein [Planctomycetota bacterium]